jgi:tetratricopeptide (TPR) repeat protein
MVGRLSLNVILDGFKQTYRTSLLEILNRFLEYGKEEDYVVIHFRCKVMNPLPSEINTIIPLINILFKKEKLNERESLLLGYVHHLGFGVPEDKCRAKEYYKKVIQMESKSNYKITKGLACVNLGLLSNDENEAMAFYDEGVRLGSGLAFFYQGVSHDRQGNIELARKCHMKASLMNIAFGHGMIGILLKEEGNIDQSYNYFAQAIMLGCHQSLDYFNKEMKQDDKEFQFLISYHSYLISGNEFYLDQSEKISIKEAFTDLASKNKEKFDEESDNDHWERIAPLLSDEVATEIINKKKIRIESISIICNEYLLRDIVHIVMNYLFISEYVNCKSTFFSKASENKLMSSIQKQGVSFKP